MPQQGSEETFSYESFAALIKEAKSHGYRFLRFDEPPGQDSGKRFYLRHDVDISPRCALRLGRIAAGLDVRSNFFFQLNAETYNVFNPANIQIVTELRSSGHCVGLHVDEDLVGTDPEAIRLTLRWFGECCTPIDAAISFHRPTPQALGRDFEGFASGYGSEVFGEDRYLSDSRRSWDFRARLTDWLAEGRSPIQLLLHPEWWHPHGSAEAIWEDLRDRRTDELARYMVTHFKKVFSPVIAIGNREFGI